MRGPSVCVIVSGMRMLTCAYLHKRSSKKCMCVRTQSAVTTAASKKR